MGEFLKAKTKKFNSNTFLFIITIVLFIAMYVAGMIVFADKGFAKPQMFTNLFINNAGLIDCNWLWYDNRYDYRRN